MDCAQETPRNRITRRLSVDVFVDHFSRESPVCRSKSVSLAQTSSPIASPAGAGLIVVSTTTALVVVGDSRVTTLLSVPPGSSRWQRTREQHSTLLRP